MTLDELERLAKAATPGPWYSRNSGVRIRYSGVEYKIADVSSPREYLGCPDTRTADHIAACSPERILAMIECIRVMEVYLVANNPTDFGCACELDYGFVCGPCRALEAQSPLYLARAKLDEVME